MTVASSTRVFFALWPPASVANAIHARASTMALDGRRVARGRLHLTLAFHGRCDDAAIAQLEHKANGVTVPAFEFVLDRCGHFQRSAISWFGPSVAPAPLVDLAAALAPSSQDRPVSHRFSPHVSVARKSAPAASSAIPPVIWRVRAFALMASGQNDAPGAYRKLAQWPLQNESVSGTRV